MINQYAQLYEAIEGRHSTRAFDGKALAPEHAELIGAACAAPPQLVPGVRAELVLSPAENVLISVAIKNAPAYFALIADPTALRVQESIGYLGEYIVLLAASLGVATCWVSGTYRPAQVEKTVHLEPNGKVYAVSPLGYEGHQGLVQVFFAKMARSTTRKPLEELVSPWPIDSRPQWMKQALEAARQAPSAANRQPWRFTVDDDSIKVSFETTGREMKAASKRLDCGIAMMHIELASQAAGVDGHWEMLESPDVAVWKTK